MPIEAELPDGTVLEFPDGTDPSVIQATVKRQLGVEMTPEQDRSITESIGRGLGLGARYLAETPGLAVGGLSDMLAKGANLILSATPTDYRLPENRAQTVSEGFTRMGFPTEESKAEELTGRVGRAVVGAGFGPAAGRTLATSPSAVTSSVGRILQESPTIQAAGATTGAGAGFAAQEAGAGPKTQMAAETVGGAVAPFAAVGGGRLAVGATRAGLGVKDALTKQGQRKVAGNILDESAVNAERASRNLADEAAFGSGVSDKTTGQASRDPGLLTLERATRALDAQGKFGQRISEANTRRQKILDVLGGDDVAVARAARNEVTGAQREAAFDQASPVTVKPVVDRINALLKSPEGSRKVVRDALETYKREIEGITDARVLYEIRKDLNDAMQGKFSRGERSDFKLAKSQLKTVKNAIDDQIEKSAPGFKKYLEDYAALSRDIEQREIIQSIQERSALAASDPATNRGILSQAKFKRMVEAEARNGKLTDEQLTVLRAIADDLDSGQAINASTVRPPGSDTAKNLTVAHIIGRALGGKTDSPLINTLFKPFGWVTQFSEDQIQGLLVDAMLDPRLARMLLAEAKPQQVHRAARTLTTVLAAGTVGSTLGAQPQLQDQKQSQ